MQFLKYASIAAITLTLNSTLAGGEPASEEKPYILASQSINITALVEAIE